jgi:phage baseplate assembly protein W
MPQVQEPADKAFLGVGLAFPIQAQPGGDLVMAAYEDDVRRAIRIVLATNPGERVMRPDFGAGLSALQFEPLGATTAALTKRRVEEALIRWEPRIDSVAATVTADARQGRLLIDVRYRVRVTNTFYNLVYPFYLVEGDRPTAGQPT